MRGKFKLKFLKNLNLNGLQKNSLSTFPYAMHHFKHVASRFYFKIGMYYGNLQIEMDFLISPKFHFRFKREIKENER